MHFVSWQRQRIWFANYSQYTLKCSLGHFVGKAIGNTVYIVGVARLQ